MKNDIKILESEHQKIIDLFLNGMSQKDIGALYGKSGDVIKSCKFKFIPSKAICLLPPVM